MEGVDPAGHWDHLRWRKLRGAGVLTAYVCRHCLQDDIFLHDHDFHEIVLITGGQGVHATVFGRRLLRRGMVIVVPPGACHGYEQCRDLALWNCCMSVDLLRGELAFLADDPDVGSLVRLDAATGRPRGVMEFTIGDKAVRDATTCLEAMLPPVSRMEHFGRLLLFLASLAKARPASSRRREMPQEPAHPAVRRAVMLISARLEHDWTLTELAREGGVDRSYFVRLFRRRLGLSPLAYLNRRRCERLAGLLLQTDRPIGQLAMTVGWDDANYAARRFKRTFGVTPRQFRAQRGIRAEPQ
ncbi:MAG: AraC family transcriptional regulator [Phycisphaeraceae bacterium]|nr:AraC family transcriptional regulator [Phycisphaeraceae bacterium]